MAMKNHVGFVPSDVRAGRRLLAGVLILAALVVLLPHSHPLFSHNASGSPFQVNLSEAGHCSICLILSQAFAAFGAGAIGLGLVALTWEDRLAFSEIFWDNLDFSLLARPPPRQ